MGAAATHGGNVEGSRISLLQCDRRTSSRSHDRADAARIGCHCQPTSHETEEQRAIKLRATLSRFADRTGASGSVCALRGAVAGAADRLRECLQSADRALPGTPTGICGADGPRCRAAAAGATDAVRRIGAEPARMRSRGVARALGDDGIGKLPEGTIPRADLIGMSLDGRAGTRRHCHCHHRPVVAAACAAGGSCRSAGGVAGGFARSRLALRESKFQRSLGRR